MTVRAIDKPSRSKLMKPWFRVEGLGFRVQGFGFRVQGLVFRVGFSVVVLREAIKLASASISGEGLGPQGIIFRVTV